MLNELERKGLIGSIEHAVWILPSGINETEQSKSRPSQPTPHFPSNIVNHYNIHRSVVAFQQDSPNSSMQVTGTVNRVDNENFVRAVESILNLIKESTLSNYAKEDFVSEIERLQELAKIEPSPQLVEHAKSKIHYLDTALKVTDIALKAGPYIIQLIAYFDSLIP